MTGSLKKLQKTVETPSAYCKLQRYTGQSNDQCKHIEYNMSFYYGKKMLFASPDGVVTIPTNWPMLTRQNLTPYTHYKKDCFLIRRLFFLVQSFWGFWAKLLLDTYARMRWSTKSTGNTIKISDTYSHGVKILLEKKIEVELLNFIIIVQYCGILDMQLSSLYFFKPFYYATRQNIFRWQI